LKIVRNKMTDAGVKAVANIISELDNLKDVTLCFEGYEYYLQALIN
jgi:hypothetical protein